MGVDVQIAVELRIWDHEGFRRYGRVLSQTNSGRQYPIKRVRHLLIQIIGVRQAFCNISFAQTVQLPRSTNVDGARSNEFEIPDDMQREFSLETERVGLNHGNLAVP